MLNKLRYNNMLYKTWHTLAFCLSSFLSPTDHGQGSQTPKWKPHLLEKIAELANKQPSLMLRHSQAQLEKNEKLQGTRHEKQLENQVNWIRKYNILPHFKCASVKKCSYRQEYFQSHQKPWNGYFKISVTNIPLHL